MRSHRLALLLPLLALAGCGSSSTQSPASPVAAAGPNQTVASGAAVTLDGSASSDPSGLALTYAWAQVSGPTVTLAGASTARPTFLAPRVASPSPAAVLVFGLVVSSANGTSSPSVVTVTVSPIPPANVAPVASAGPNQAVVSGASVTLDGSGSADLDLQSITYAWTQTSGTPVTLAGATTVHPTFTAPTVAAGSPAAVLVFSLVVSDVDASSSPSTVTITVNPAAPGNPPPVASAGPDQSVASGAAVTLDGSASADPDLQALTYAWTQVSGTAVSLAGATTAQPTFTAPTVASGSPAAVLVFSLVVSDANASSSPTTVTVTVNPAAPTNPPPIASAGPNQAVASGAAVTLDGSGSHDPDLQAITYAWTQASGATVSLAGATTAHPTFTAPTVAAGSPAAALVFSLVVSDANASSSPSTVTVTVNPTGNLCQSGGPPPAPPGTPPPAPPGTPPPGGASGSGRFQMGTYLPIGLYVVDPVPGEATVEGFVVVTFSKLRSPAPADAVVTMNGVPLKRITGSGASGLFWQLDPAGQQPVVGAGGALTLVASATDPDTGKPIQRSLVLPCPSDVPVTTTPVAGAVLVTSTAGSPSAVRLTSSANLTLNTGIPLMSGSPPTATLWGYEPCTRALVGYGGPHPIQPGPLNLDVPVCDGASTGTCVATSASAYLLDLRWPGPFEPDGESGGFCGLAKRFSFGK